MLSPPILITVNQCEMQIHITNVPKDIAKGIEKAKAEVGRKSTVEQVIVLLKEALHARSKKQIL